MLACVCIHLCGVEGCVDSALEHVWHALMRVILVWIRGLRVHVAACVWGRNSTCTTPWRVQWKDGASIPQVWEQDLSPFEAFGVNDCCLYGR
jgi:hypothetical protein